MEILKKYEVMIGVVALLILIKITTYRKWIGYFNAMDERNRISHHYQTKTLSPQQNLALFVKKAKSSLQNTESSLYKFSIENETLTLELISPNPIESFKTLEALLIQHTLEMGTIEIKASGNMAHVIFTCKQKT